MADSKDYITYSENKGSVNIAEEVIAAIAANAAVETEGVAALASSLSSDIAEFLGKKNLLKGVKVTLDGEKLKIDVFIVVKLGYAVNKVGEDVQSAVRQEIESATGSPVEEVNVRISGVALDKDK